VAFGHRQQVLQLQSLFLSHAAAQRKPDGHIADFAELLHAVAALDGVERIRYTTSHPLEFSDAIITYRKNKRPFHPSPTALDRS
ncbi:hypothetical protein H8M98_31445, partial [Pseudomonas aeruginosa]|nr:hypothetical protein [Pseudomonas aeruginosa]MBK1591842.1 hypothetical protein [Pseudomonas aeruginosa]